MSILNRLTLNGHLDDRAIAAAWADVTADGQAAHPHLATCAACRARFDGLATWLDDLRDEAVSEADEAFPADRLAAQQSAILRRIEAAERPARVIAFPKGPAPMAAAARPVRRWIAGAAAAGLVAGMALGNYMDLRHALEPQPSFVADTSPSASRGAIQPVSVSVSDEELLGFMADADSRTLPDSLVAYESMTPRARDMPQ